MNFKPLDDCLLVKVDEVVTKSAGGLYLPGADKEAPRTGVIVRLGDDVELNKIFKVGMKVVFQAYSGDNVEFDGNAYQVFRRDDILGYFEV